MEPVDEPNEQKILFIDTEAKAMKPTDSARSAPDKEGDYDEAAINMFSKEENIALRSLTLTVEGVENNLDDQKPQVFK